MVEPNALNSVLRIQDCADEFNARKWLDSAAGIWNNESSKDTLKAMKLFDKDSCPRGIPYPPELDVLIENYNGEPNYCSIHSDFILEFENAPERWLGAANKKEDLQRLFFFAKTVGGEPYAIWDAGDGKFPVIEFQDSQVLVLSESFKDFIRIMGMGGGKNAFRPHTALIPKPYSVLSQLEIDPDDEEWNYDRGEFRIFVTDILGWDVPVEWVDLPRKAFMKYQKKLEDWLKISKNSCMDYYQ